MGEVVSVVEEATRSVRPVIMHFGELCPCRKAELNQDHGDAEFVQVEGNVVASVDDHYKRYGHKVPVVVVDDGSRQASELVAYARDQRGLTVKVVRAAQG